MLRHLCCVCLAAFLLPQQLPIVHATDVAEFSFTEPIDAVSVLLKEDVLLRVSALVDDAWTPWQELRVENEQDPALRESNLVMFPRAVSVLRFDRAVFREDIHPIRVASDPIRFRVAATSSIDHRILSRSDWGADDSLLIVKKPSSSISSQQTEEIPSDNSTGSPSAREKDCRDAYVNYPTEFKASAAVTENANGEKLRWAQQYSPGVRLLVVHHTALKVAGDARPGVERMRALYQYHAENRGWGDIGYHFVIDEEGGIYEGKAGGDSVVGGHVYCANVGTVGVALMGNFDDEEPSQQQVKSLQWLLRLLADKYGIDMGKNVTFHGKELSPIVGHRQLVSTDCPGYSMWNALAQVRENVKKGNVDSAVAFIPRTPRPMETEEVAEEGTIPTGPDGLAALESTVIEGRPNGEIILPVYFRASRKNYNKNARVARIARPAGVLLWQEIDGKFKSIRGDIRIPVPLLKKGQSVVMKVKVRLPADRGNVEMKIGSLRYTFAISGKRLRTPQLLSTGGGQVTLTERASPAQQTRQSSSVTSAPSVPPIVSAPSPSIRILLSRWTAKAPNLTVMSSGSANVNGMNFPGNAIGIRMSGSSCEAFEGDRSQTSGAVRIDPGAGTLVLRDDAGTTNEYRGIVECRVVDGKLALINELDLETYLQGLAEEPDTEPFEKRRAFAIAARTYAAYYLDSANRKFPGMPYDGSDDPAAFQAYAGVEFEQKNPGWLRAAASTAAQVLKFAGQLIKPPYFSSNDGKTRTPTEAGWSNFPFASIFSSKPDPWCAGMTLRGHGVGMSGCGAKGQANEGKTAEQILQYYYPGTTIGG